MITRPLDLASKLRPEPRNLDWLFLVNGGLIVLFFSLAGSRFVLAPGLGVDFRLPVMAGAREGAAQTTHVISVLSSGLVFTDAGRFQMGDLGAWLKAEAKKAAAKQMPRPSLLVRADAGVTTADLTAIRSAAAEAGFVSMILGAEPPARPDIR